MDYTKKTVIIWDSLNGLLIENGTHADFYKERQSHLDQMVANHKTDTVEGMIEFIDMSATGRVSSTERVWADQVSAEQHIQFIKDLADKYGVLHTINSAEIIDNS